MENNESLLLDTSFIVAFGRDPLVTLLSSTTSSLSVTTQVLAECREQRLYLPNGISEQRGYRLKDFNNEYAGLLFTTANSSEGISIQLLRGDIGWQQKLNCGCNANSIAFVNNAGLITPLYFCRGVADDEADFSNFACTLLNPGTKTITRDKHLGWALNDKALYDVNIVDAMPWSKMTPDLLRKIEQDKARINGVTGDSTSLIR